MIQKWMSLVQICLALTYLLTHTFKPHVNYYLCCWLCKFSRFDFFLSPACTAGLMRFETAWRIFFVTIFAWYLLCCCAPVVICMLGRHDKRYMYDDQDLQCGSILESVSDMHMARSQGILTLELHLGSWESVQLLPSLGNSLQVTSKHFITRLTELEGMWVVSQAPFNADAIDFQSYLNMAGLEGRLQNLRHNARATTHQSAYAIVDHAKRQRLNGPDAER